VQVEVIEYIEVIQEQFHEHLEVFTKCHIHCPLVGWSNIFQAKGHDYPINKCSLICNEGIFEPIFWGNHYLMITQKAIQKWIDFMPSHHV
jgi:hypothetical protein